MMILTSPDVVAPNGAPSAELVSVLMKLRADGHAVAVLSNNQEPAWFGTAFGGSSVQFLSVRGRQDGKIVSENAKRLGLPAHDAVVLAGKMEDVEMGKNGQAVLVAAGWTKDPRVADLGIRVATPAQFEAAMRLVSGWGGDWWYQHTGEQYAVRVLCDLSSKGAASAAQVAFSERMTTIVKKQGTELWGLLTCLARSMLVEGFGTPGRKTMWGVFPSSSSRNDDSDSMCDFTHRLRTTVTRVHMAKRGKPLFIRHRPTTKRSSAGARHDRQDPAEELQSLHLNPAYENSIRGRDVVVLDDCSTYGLSFGVASALLRAAGASTVMCVAIGKFGNQCRTYDIAVRGSPFRPLRPQDYVLNATPRLEPGQTSKMAQNTLLTLFS